MHEGITSPQNSESSSAWDELTKQPEFVKIAVAQAPETQTVQQAATHEVTEADKELIRNSNFHGHGNEFAFTPEKGDGFSTIIQKFSDESWQKLDKDERINAISELYGQLGEKLGITLPYALHTYEDDTTTTGYQENIDDIYRANCRASGEQFDENEPDRHDIFLNTRTLDRPESTLNVASHEFYHLYQRQCELDPQDKLGSIYRANTENYTPCSVDSQAYMNQPLEEEAFRFGRMFSALYLKACFYDDNPNTYNQQFAQYIEDRKAEMAKAANQ